LTRQIRELLNLIRDYGPNAVAAAMAKAHAAGAFGSDYIANILRQQQSRRDVQPPLELKDPALNQLATDPLSLAEYDALILRSRKEESCESTGRETESTQPDDNKPESGPNSE
jgi:predicted component of type VI protein secretion system